MIKDILVFTTVKRLEPETVKAIFELEWEGAISLLLQQDNPTGIAYKDHLHQYRRGMEVFLRGPYEAMLVVESDVIPPKEALMRLARVKADIVYGCCLFQKTQVVNIMERYKPWPEVTRNIGEPLTSRNLWEAACKLGVVECSGAGLACTLIHRRVLETVPFEEANYEGYFDYGWTEKVYRHGFRMMADTRVKCGHKDTEGRITWPK